MNFFLAHRFFKSNTADSGRRASAPAIRIATIGMAVGLAVMILSVSIVRGFQREVSNKVTGFAAHIEVLNPGTFGSPEGYPVVADSAFLAGLQTLPQVTSVQCYSEKIGILKTEESFQAISLKGVGESFLPTFIGANMLEGEFPAYRDSVDSNRIVISSTVANALHLSVGSRVYAYFFEDAVKMRRFDIAGIYKTNLRQFDKVYAFTGKRSVDKLNGWQRGEASGIELRVRDFDEVNSVAAQVRHWLAGRASDSLYTETIALSVKENPRTEGIFHWLALLDTNVWVILILLLCVAGFTMVSGLLILILERTNTIGILKALGATNARIRHIFLNYALLIAVRGMLAGNATALALIFLQRHTGLFRLNPETYYIDTVPVDISLLPILSINIATLTLTMLVLVAPSYMISRIEPAKAIRFD